MEAPPLFIVGCDRSGTTLLRLMLTQHPDLHIPQESGFLDTLRHRTDAYGAFTQPHQRWFFIRDLQQNEATSKTKTFPIFDLTVAEAEAALTEAAPTDFPGASATLFAASAQKHGKERWGDKTPRYVLRLTWLAEAFPEAQFVHLLRDGRDVAASLRKAGWLPSIRAGAQYWKERVEAGRKAGKALPPERYYELRYEDLVLDPEETLQALCQWLNLAYTPDLLSFHREGKARVPDEHADLFEQIDRPIDSARAYAWERTMTFTEMADVEDAASDLLEKLGYRRTERKLPLWVRGARALHNTTLPVLDKAKRVMNGIAYR